MTDTITGLEQSLILKSDSRGRVKLPVERREELLDEFERSGMSGRAFAAWAGVKYPTFAHWRQQRRERKEAGPERPEMKWVEAMMPVEAAASGPKGAADSKGLVIHFTGGVRVEAANGRQAAELLMALGVARC